MARDGGKTVRFAQVVARAGEPQAHTLWVAPEKDREFTRAVKTHRVLTVQRGATTDYGIVGFDPGHGDVREYLVFPRTLKPFAGARVIGIKFDLIAQPKDVPARTEPSRAPARRRQQPSRSSAHRKNDRARTTPLVPDSNEAPTSKPARRPTSHPKPPATKSDLRTEVRAALRELKSGQTVAAYERLEHALNS